MLEFAFGLQPIVKLIAREAATLKIDFIGAVPDFFATWRMVCGSVFCARLNGACVRLQSLIFLAFTLQCHTRVLSFRNCLPVFMGLSLANCPQVARFRVVSSCKTTWCASSQVSRRLPVNVPPPNSRAANPRGSPDGLCPPSS